MRKNAGFTLIELMIVVEIIAIMVAIAVPNYLRTRIQANESNAVGSLRTVLNAQMTYNTVNLVYATNFDALTTAEPPYLTGNWTSERSGYLFTLEGDGSSFAARATPTDFGNSGYHGFYVDPSGIVHYQIMAEANADSPVLGQLD